MSKEIMNAVVGLLLLCISIVRQILVAISQPICLCRSRSVQWLLLHNCKPQENVNFFESGNNFSHFLLVLSFVDF